MSIGGGCRAVRISNGAWYSHVSLAPEMWWGMSSAPGIMMRSISVYDGWPAWMGEATERSASVQTVPKSVTN